MEEASSSILLSSTILVQGLADTVHLVSCALGGLIAGEGSFIVTKKETPYADGTTRPRFVFQLEMASRDRPLILALAATAGFGSVKDVPARQAGWQPSTYFRINSIKAHRAWTIPFCERYLPPTAKREQFERWRDALDTHESLHPSRHGKGPSTCSVEDCPFPVRGRGLCRKHYYRATGY